MGRPSGKKSGGGTGGSGSSGSGSGSTGGSGSSGSGSGSSGSGSGSSGSGSGSSGSTTRSGSSRPTSVTTNNPSVATQNSGAVFRSAVTNNPTVATPNNRGLNPRQKTAPPTRVDIPEKLRLAKLEKIKSQIRLPSQIVSVADVRYVENPNNINPQVIQSPNLTPFTIPITKGELTQAATKEFALHLSGTKTIDPQRLQAIQEGRIIVTKGIETTFTPSEQQLRVLQAMESQKKAEKEQSRANSEWQKKQDSMQAKIREMEAAKQKTEDFRNRTNEEVLQNFIKVQTQKELSGDYGTNPEVPTNLNQYLTERGYDVTKPETIPTSVFKPTRLDTPEKLRAAGVAESIIHTIMGTERSVENPNDTITNVMTNTTIDFDRGTNWSGITETPCRQCNRAPCPCNLPPFRDTPTENNLYTPPNATNINQPIGRSTPLPPSVTTTGLSPPRTTLVEETVDATASAILPDFKSLALIAGAFILT